MDLTRTRVWAEIDLTALEYNYHQLRSKAPKAKFLGVCKADAYGHGADIIAKKLEFLGADMLAVACLQEGITLREQGVKCPILCFGDTPPQLGMLLVLNSITQMVQSVEQARALAEIADHTQERVTVHIKLDTGMGRLGMLCEDLDLVADEIAEIVALDGVEVEGLFTHLARSEEESLDGVAFTDLQQKRFTAVIQKLTERKVTIPICHMANSGGALYHKNTHFDMIRPGIALYGYHPDKKRENDIALKPVMVLKSRVSAVRELPKGWKIGYGCTETLDRDSVLAVLPIGYGDGYSRRFSNGMKVLLQDTLCPIVGRVSMDMCMVDVTAIGTQVKVGDIAVLYGKEELLTKGATLCDTIAYELLCRVSPRVPRIYL